ncbi:WD repeat-containing protein 55 [Araneus ventricosus]|uniref:WD repeat-containing protein 55 homolog n=1 Tax=Araneus ventricosus TaxID=182803 RepID=A0A4Y2JG21_ARAVE|nr:WD repeat-containing protein 55 [Araneus ventricosus]
MVRCLVDISIRKMSSSSEGDSFFEASGSESDREELALENEDTSGEIEQKTEVPESIKFNVSIVDIACHPKRNLIAAGLIDGAITLHSYGVGDVKNMELQTFDHHKKPCRAVHFSASGEHLFTGAQDTTICVVDLETNSVFRKFARDGGSPLYSILPIDNYLLASGEDDGQVILWDFRMQAPIECFEDCEDYVSSLVINKEKKLMLATSGDGILSVYNVRAKKLEMQSEELDSDLLCSGIFKGGTKAVVGSTDGALNIFNWGEFGNISDRFPGHPGSVDSMAVVADDVIVTGCEDGKVRAVQLFPNRFLGSLGSHGGYSVERVRLCYDSAYIASSSHDQKIKFWDLSGIEDLKNEDVKETKQKHKQLNKPVNDFFADLA